MFGWLKKYNRLYDRELIELFKSKQDMDALGTLFSRYSHLVASIAIGILKDKEKAEDVVQEIFEVVVKDLKKHDVKNFNSWIYSVTKFHCFKVKKVNEFSQSADSHAWESLCSITKRVTRIYKGSREI